MGIVVVDDVDVDVDVVVIVVVSSVECRVPGIEDLKMEGRESS